jgi:hypothetical protein
VIEAGIPPQISLIHAEQNHARFKTPAEVIPCRKR